MRRVGRRGWIGIAVAFLLALLFLKMCVRIVPEDAPRPVRTIEQAPATGAGVLLIPVEGVPANALTDTFTQARASGTRPHDAIDIPAERGRGVLAAADGRIEKLFTSKDGGLTVYERSVDGRRIYYYAHLDRYAPGLREGNIVRQGQRIASVGSTGNADPQAPHLHFAVHDMATGEPWHGGRPVNPYPLLTRAAR